MYVTLSYAWLIAVSPPRLPWDVSPFPGLALLIPCPQQRPSSYSGPPDRAVTWQVSPIKRVLYSVSRGCTENFLSPQFGNPFGYSSARKYLMCTVRFIFVTKGDTPRLIVGCRQDWLNWIPRGGGAGGGRRGVKSWCDVVDSIVRSYVRSSRRWVMGDGKSSHTEEL